MARLAGAAAREASPIVREAGAAAKGGAAASGLAQSGAVKSVEGDLMHVVTGFVEASPQTASGLFQVPTTHEMRAITKTWDAIRGGDLAGAAKLADPLGMDVVRFTDTATSRELSMLIERPTSAGTYAKGWGMFVHSPDAVQGSLHVQVPHPWDDIATEVLGVNLLRNTDASSLAVAGASRFTVPDRLSDAAHALRTPFNAVSRANATEGAHLLQVHGFQAAKHPDYGHVVLSRGADPSSWTHTTADILRERKWKALMFDGQNLPALGARTNVQGKFARAHGADFLHVEVADTIRLEPERAQRFAHALGKASTEPLRAHHTP